MWYTFPVRDHEMKSKRKINAIMLVMVLMAQAVTVANVSTAADMYQRRQGTTVSAKTILVEAEDFKDRGAWRVDTQFTHEMGSAYLLAAGVLKPDADLSCFSLTGYSGGGKKMIAEYREHANAARLEAPRLYGLTQQHKHLPEMKKLAGLAKDPHFCPIVSSYYAGMEVMVPVFAKDLNGGLDEIKRVYREYYTGRVVRFAETMDEGGLISSGAFAGRDDMQVSVTGNDERIVLVARFDNLGKGASGAAIQNMNIVLGTEETAGLKVEE